MIAKNVTREQLEQALSKTSKMFGNNLTWRRTPEALNAKSTRFGFTLRAIDSKGKGGRISRQLVDWQTRECKEKHIGQSACWHAHGHFFESLLKIEPEAVIRAGKITIDKNGGNWQDYNIGSMIMPFYYSEACKCDN